MNASTIRNFYFALLFLSIATETFLVFLNLQNLKKKEVPQDLKETFGEDAIIKSKKYSATGLKFGLLSTYYSALVIVLFISYGWFNDLLSIINPPTDQVSWLSVLYVVAVSLVFSLIEIPFSLYKIFVIEEKFGFNRMTVKLWLSDTLKGLILSLLIGAPIIYALLFFIQSTGSYWWLYAAIFIGLFQLIIMYLYPAVIAPLFNKFVPIEEGELKEKIDALTKSLNFAIAGIFKMDGSKRSSHGNAYFAGIGSKKRIVLFDTLIESMSPKQATAVLAHEIGHQKLGHIKKMLIFSFFSGIVGFWILDLLIGSKSFYQAFGVETVLPAAALVLFGFAADPISYFLSPLFNILSRRFEYQADSYAAKAVGNSEDLSTSLLKLANDNLSNPVPHPLYSFFHYSHPSLSERLEALKNIK